MPLAYWFGREYKGVVWGGGPGVKPVGLPLLGLFCYNICINITSGPTNFSGGAT
jgi:hypothetical protein